MSLLLDGACQPAECPLLLLLLLPSVSFLVWLLLPSLLPSSFASFMLFMSTVLLLSAVVAASPSAAAGA